jgi:nitrogen fixation NifU-like protein
MNLDNLYQEVILDHYKNPLNDEITLNITLTGNTISKITWDGVGCSISQASVSIASDLLVGKTLDVSESITEEFMDLMQSKGKKSGNELVLEDAVALAGVSQYPARIKCALLGWMAIKDAAMQASSK